MTIQYDPLPVTTQRRQTLNEALAYTTATIPTPNNPCPTCEDCEWLTDNGEFHPDRLATRIGIRYSSLLRHLQRHHRHDLRDRLDASKEQAA